MRCRSYVLAADGERLVVTPGATLTEADGFAIRQSKPHLLALLQGAATIVLPEHWTKDERTLLAATPGLSSGLLGSPEWIPQRQARR